MENSSTEGRPQQATEEHEVLAQRMVKVRVKLALRQPFMASALFRLPLVGVDSSTWCSTMATDGMHIFYNPRWVATLSDTQIQAVMAHELLHVVMNHNARQRGRDAQRWNMACDFCINGMLKAMGFDLPEGGLLDRRFDQRTSEEIYEALESVWQKFKSQPDFMGPDLVDASDPRVRANLPAQSPDEENMRALRTALQETVQQGMKGSGAGSLSEREFAQTQAARVDWRSVLNNLLQSAVMCDWSSIPFAKKHLHRGIYLPSVSKPQAQRIVFAIDTSGSVDDRQIADIMNELVSFSSLHEGPLTVLQCDVKIRHVMHINDLPGERGKIGKLSIKGRGGTEFKPVFEWVKHHTTELGDIALLVYATDGCGAFPENAPPYQVLWMLTDDSTPLAKLPFGLGVRIKTSTPI